MWRQWVNQSTIQEVADSGSRGACSLGLTRVLLRFHGNLAERLLNRGEMKIAPDWLKPANQNAIIGQQKYRRRDQLRSDFPKVRIPDFRDCVCLGKEKGAIRERQEYVYRSGVWVAAGLCNLHLASQLNGVLGCGPGRGCRQIRTRP